MLCKPKWFIILSLLIISCSTSTDGNNKNDDNDDDLVTFTADIKPLVLSKCTPCHVDGGSQPNWTVYATAKANISTIVTRTANGEMPRNGANGGLNQAQKDLFAQWITDGLLE